MRYVTKSNLIPIPEDHRKPLLETLDLYDAGDDLSNSPLIKSKINLGRLDVWKDIQSDIPEIDALRLRQDKFIYLYKDIKEKGLQNNVIWVWFDEEGQVHLYDGYHRLAILEHLGLTVPIEIETEWTGGNNGHHKGNDFALVETLKNEHPKGEYLYQPVDDIRIRNWKIDRPDSPQRLDYILQHLVKGTVLDIGCSEGYFSRGIARQGYQVTAVDHEKGFVAANRYLSLIEGLDVQCKYVEDWSEAIGEYDNVLLLSVIHNDMKKIGVDEGLKKLELLRGKCKQLFLEVPQVRGERQWNKDPYPHYIFQDNIPALEEALEMKCEDTHYTKEGGRAILLFTDEKPETPKWWELSQYIPDWRNQYWPLFNTLKSNPIRNIMEIGTYDGKNGVVMIKTAAQKVPEEEINYYGFDLFEEKTAAIASQEFAPATPISINGIYNFMQENTGATVNLFKGNTRHTLKWNLPNLPKMDLIYIDGGHSIETTRNDWHYAQKLMHKDTIVFFDDYNDEMPFIGSKFIVDELDTKYEYTVFPQTNYYKRPFGRLKCQLLKVTLKKKTRRLKKEHYRFHLLGLPHSKTIDNWGPCAFTQLVYRFSKMMKGEGHEVYHYGTEGSDSSISTEQIDVLTEEVQKEAYGDWSPYKQLWIHNGGDLAYRTFRTNAIKEIQKRKEPGDILLISNGYWLKEVGDKAGSGMAVVEPFVGYIGHYARYKVFPSYAWMEHTSGVALGTLKKEKPKENFSNGNWYDCVIPHFFNPEDHTYCEDKEDYFLYMGRLIQRKGIHVAVDLCKRIGMKLKIAGQPMWPDNLERSLRHVGIDPNNPLFEYLGVLSPQDLDPLKSKAKCVLVPSIYKEPFGLVVPEALLSGTPVITTDWGSFPEIVPQGRVGYRCRTMDDFIWAANHIHKIKSKDCRIYAEKNFSCKIIAKAYNEYFMKVHDRFKGGWYEMHPERKNLDWLKRY